MGRVSRRTAAILFSCARVCVRTMKKKFKQRKEKKKKKEEEERINKTSQFLRTLAILRHDHKG